MSENDNERFMPRQNSTPGEEDNASKMQDHADGSPKPEVAEDSIGDTYDYFHRRLSEEENKTPESLPDDDSRATDGEEPAKSDRRISRWVQFLLIGVGCLVVGVAVGFYFRQLSRPFQSREEKAKEEISRQINEKLGSVAYLVRQEYVDELSIDTITRMAVSGLMESLDPHSLYISKEELQAVNEDLEGEFTGVGVQFLIYEDSIAVVEAIPGGPAAKVGVMAGDRILSADDKPLSGVGKTNDDVFKALRGKDGSTVKIKVKRPSTRQILTFNVVRGRVPVSSIEAYYMLDDGKTGYIKISRFAANTYVETIAALTKLTARGARQFVLDLRDNTGGFMDQAALIANEFLPRGRKIVYTKSRRPENHLDIDADGTGIFQHQPIAVIINENSASASEILAGAIQDNDRGAIVGRRSFGKGLVQNQFDTPEGGAIRLTVARYYTPSGRSIQREYTLGNREAYEEDIWTRYTNGEIFSADSIKLDKSKVFKTVGGRKVYGGGGIMPDYFVPEDTTHYTPYYIKALNMGLVQQFAFRISDSYRSLTKNVSTYSQMERILPSGAKMINLFAEYAEENGLPAAWFYINQSSDMLLNKIRAFIGRDLKDNNWFYRYYNANDPTLYHAVEALKLKKLPNEPVKKSVDVAR